MHGETNEGNEVRQDALAARAFDLRLLQRRVGLPELGFVPEIGRLFDGVGQILNVLELQPLFVGLAVEDLQGGDLVFVLLMNCSKDCTMVRARAKCVGAEACFDDLVLADVVNRQFVLLFDLDQEFANFGS